MGEIIIANIDKCLVKIGKTRAKMMRDCGIPEASMRQWKRGSVPLATTLYKVARYLGVTVEYLLTGIENENEVTAEPSAEYKIELPEDSKRLLENFDKLNARDRNLIMTMCQTLAASNEK